MESPVQYTFKMLAMDPTKRVPGGEVRMVDPGSFPASTTVAAALVTLKSGAFARVALASERIGMTVLDQRPGKDDRLCARRRARTMDFNPNDVGFVPNMTATPSKTPGTSTSYSSGVELS
jgi:oxalate decarboxylase